MTTERELLVAAASRLSQLSYQLDPRSYQRLCAEQLIEEIDEQLNHTEYVWRMASYNDDGTLQGVSRITLDPEYVDIDGSYSSSGARRERAEVRWEAG